MMAGKVAKKLGDGLLALFGYPVAQEKQCRACERRWLSTGVGRIEPLELRHPLSHVLAIAGDVPAKFEMQNAPATTAAAARLHGAALQTGRAARAPTR
jgi:hypothetical protein